MQTTVLKDNSAWRSTELSGFTTVLTIKGKKHRLGSQSNGEAGQIEVKRYRL
jgi:hypothetical protein